MRSLDLPRINTRQGSTAKITLSCRAGGDGNRLSWQTGNNGRNSPPKRVADGGLCAALHKQEALEQEFWHEKGSSGSCFSMLISEDGVGTFIPWATICYCTAFLCLNSPGKGLTSAAAQGNTKGTGGSTESTEEAHNISFQKPAIKIALTPKHRTKSLFRGGKQYAVKS